jgi:arylsulfatase A-like enzyme
LILVAAAALAGCTKTYDPLDLLRSTARLHDATVAGRDRQWVLGQIGKQIRINDTVLRTLPASPPSRLSYAVDVGKDMRLAFSCGIPPERHGEPGVEFLVKIKHGSREDVVFQSTLEPIARPTHRKWVAADVDLAAYTGRSVEIVFETRGFAKDSSGRAAFWGAPALTVPRDTSPLVILYLVDTLRADHTGPYGYARDTTPQLNAFAKDAVVFETAISQASWTKPSVASIMTSLLPARHRAVQLRDALDLSQVTLAEMMEAKGFSTGAVIANSVIYLQGSNFEQGFDGFAGMHGAGNRPSKVVEAGPVVDHALAWLDARRGLPNFLYVHTMDPHVPYTPPAPFNHKFEPYPTPEHPAIDPRTDYKEPADRERLMAQYDGEIAYGDQEFGRFVAGLKQRGLYDRALVIFVGDHGEEFFDHGQWLHGRSVFDELIHIPLVVKFPQQRDAGKRVAQQVQEVDILPTILEEQGFPVPAPPAIVGQPLQPVLKGTAPEPPAVSEISHRGFVAHGMRTSKDKYIQRFSPQEDELYFDVVKDPKETTNLAEQSEKRVRSMRDSLQVIMTPNPYRHTLRLSGTSAYDLWLHSGGWIEGVIATGFGLADKYESAGNNRKLAIRAHPKPGQPREISFEVRPAGAPVWLEGTQDGKPLALAQIFIAREAKHPTAVPFRLPDVEAGGENEVEDSLLHMFEAPPDKPGIQIWLVADPKSSKPIGPFDDATRENLCGLGYIPCPEKKK